MSTTLVLTLYAPKQGPDAAKNEAMLIDLLRRHHGALRLAGVATETKPIVGKSTSGAYLELLELKGLAAVELAEKSAAVKELRERFAAVADRTALGSLAEAGSIPATFARVTLPTGLL